MKYGLKTILRTPARSALLALLLAAATAFLTLGGGMWRSANDLLAQADATFITAGELVYTLGNYPDTAYDDPLLSAVRAAFDLGDYRLDGAQLVEPHVTQRAHIAGYEPPRGDMPLKNVAVMTVRIGGYENTQGAFATDVLSYQYGGERGGAAAYIARPSQPDCVLESGRIYVVFGAYLSQTLGRVKHFQILSFCEDMGLDAAYGQFPPVVDVTDGEAAFWASPAGAYYRKAAEAIDVLNRSIDVAATRRPEAVTEFHRNEYTLTEGAFFTETDGAVCVVPHSLATRLSLAVGDTLPLSFYHGGSGYGRGLDFWRDEGFAAELAFTVVGIYQSDRTNAPVFVPAAGQAWLAGDDHQYTLGRVIVDNRAAEAYAAAARVLLPDGVSLELYDQGYTAAARSLLSMRETAMLITAACGAACLLILCFFAFLFVYRNGASVRILLMLGAGEGRTRLFLLTGCGVVAAAAVCIGGAVGYVISQGVIDAVFASIQVNSVYDNRFSIKGYGVRSDAFTAAPRVDAGVFILLAGAVLLLTLALCLLFARRVLRAQNPRNLYEKRKKHAPRAERVAVHPRRAGLRLPLPGVSLRYGASSILRGGGRSVAVPVLFAALVVFLCLFSALQEGYGGQLDRVYDDIPVAMKFTDLSGRKIDNLVLTDAQLAELEETGLVRDGWSANNFRCFFDGLVKHADGISADVPPMPFVMPTGFALDAFMGQYNLLTSPIVVTNQVERAPEFFYAGLPSITWAGGVDWDDYLTLDDTPYCLAAEGFLAENGLKLGDTIAVTVFYYGPGTGSVPDTLPITLTIGGTFPSMRKQGTLYVPAGTITIGGSGGSGTTYHRIYNSAGFLADDTRNLSEFKDWLSLHYDLLGSAGVNRKWVIIDDAALYDTVDSLTRHIGYMDLLYPVLLTLVAVIGFVASTLLLKSRTREIALLRSMGARKRTVFLSLFWEQLLLCLSGAAVGATCTAALFGVVGERRAWLFAVVAVCYLLGAAVAIAQTQRIALMKNLMDG